MLMKEPQRWRLIQLRLVRSPSPCGRPIIHVHGTARAVVAIDPSPCCAWKDAYILYIYINLYIYVCLCIYVTRARACGGMSSRANSTSRPIYIYVYIYIYSHHGMPCYLQRAHTSMRVRSQAILLSYMLHGPPSPNQHIGGRTSAHRMCVGRDDLASSFAIDVPFETDFFRECIRLRMRPHATDRPTQCCA